MEQYGKFCEQYGKISSAIQIYQSMLDKFICMPAKMTAIKTRLAACVSNSPTEKPLSYLEYLNNVNRIENKEELIATIKEDL